MADDRLNDPIHIAPVDLARALIRRPSVTPTDAGAMAVLEEALAGLGFHCRRMRFGEIENLYARHGETGPNLCFAGHTDVVPVGDAEAWSAEPFEGEVRDGALYGRGAVDMKGAVAAFAAAAARTLAAGEVKGSLSFLITGDEEGVAVDGTVKVVEALLAEGETVDHCIVGEPSSAVRLGDMIKVGRRGSMNAWITVEGVQGHVAYPQRAANPVPALIDLLARLNARVLDEGYPEFQPSNLEVVDLRVGNPATNVIPAKAEARLNIRFNPSHTGAALTAWLEGECAAARGRPSIPSPARSCGWWRRRCRRRRAKRPSCPPQAAPRTHASSAPSARWWSSAWSEPPCTRWTSTPPLPRSTAWPTPTARSSGGILRRLELSERRPASFFAARRQAPGRAGCTSARSLSRP